MSSVAEVVMQQYNNEEDKRTLAPSQYLSDVKSISGGAIYSAAIYLAKGYNNNNSTTTTTTHQQQNINYYSIVYHILLFIDISRRQRP